MPDPTLLDLLWLLALALLALPAAMGDGEGMLEIGREAAGGRWVARCR